MSRVDKKKIEKKQKIKETIIGIALAIAIGVGGSVGSYAYFSDIVKSDNGIKITMGTLNVTVEDDEGFKKGDSENTYIRRFKIRNNGTLDEKLTFMLKDVSIPTGNGDLNKIKYKLQTEGKELIQENTLYNLSNLSEEYQESIVTLKSGESISCTATLTTDGSESNNTQIEFNLFINGFQINDDELQGSGGAN